jgi:hypothetical protein
MMRTVRPCIRRRRGPPVLAGINAERTIGLARKEISNGRLAEREWKEHFIDRSFSMLFDRPDTPVPICFVLTYRIWVAYFHTSFKSHCMSKQKQQGKRPIPSRPELYRHNAEETPTPPAKHGEKKPGFWRVQ